MRIPPTGSRPFAIKTGSKNDLTVSGDYPPLPPLADRIPNQPPALSDPTQHGIQLARINAVGTDYSLRDGIRQDVFERWFAPAFHESTPDDLASVLF
jgi:hypothetical protein